jgi:predicted MPP superfamily phosphohydrolase
MDLIEENNKKLSRALSNHKYYEKKKKEKKPQKDLYKELVIKIKNLNFNQLQNLKIFIERDFENYYTTKYNELENKINLINTIKKEYEENKNKLIDIINHF